MVNMPAISLNRRKAVKTDGDSAPPQLTEKQGKIVGIIGTASVEGVSGGFDTIKYGGITLDNSWRSSTQFVCRELKCCPECTGLEDIKILDALKIAFGWKLIQDRNDSACSRIRQNIVKYMIIPRIGFGFAFCLTEFGLLCYENFDNVSNFDPTLESVIVVFVIMALYLVALTYNACCTNNLSKVNFYLGLLVLFKVIDLVLNSTLLMLAYEYTFKDVTPDLNITYLIYIFSIFEVTMCAIHLLKTAFFTIRRSCFKVQEPSDTEMSTVSTISKP